MMLATSKAEDNMEQSICNEDNDDDEEDADDDKEQDFHQQNNTESNANTDDDFNHDQLANNKDSNNNNDDEYDSNNQDHYNNNNNSSPPQEQYYNNFNESHHQNLQPINMQKVSKNLPKLAKPKSTTLVNRSSKSMFQHRSNIYGQANNAIDLSTVHRHYSQKDDNSSTSSHSALAEVAAQILPLSSLARPLLASITTNPSQLLQLTHQQQQALLMSFNTHFNCLNNNSNSTTHN
jgi:hypothetical protein